MVKIYVDSNFFLHRQAPKLIFGHASLDTWARVCLKVEFLSYKDFPGSSDGKVSVYNVGDLGLIPGSGRSPGEGNGTPLQYYCLENPMDGGAW